MSERSVLFSRWCARRLEANLQIILVHRRLKQARTLTLTTRHALIALAILIFLIMACAAILNYATLRAPFVFHLPFMQGVLREANQEQFGPQDKYLRGDLNAMAAKLGEMQAKLMRLEALAERVSGLAGINPKEFDFQDTPPRGGAAPAGGGRDLSMAEFQTDLDHTALGIEQRSDYLNVVESSLMDAKLKSKMMPTALPVNVTYDSSGFGMRIDPFTGKWAMHEGIDFVANTGTPINAAAGGVVVVAEWNHDFGNMVEIDHGNGLSTLYAHASRIYVHVGDVVRRGQHIADVGATGHATGPHLHFEVHVKGVPQDPAKFLALGGARPDQIVARAGTLTEAALKRGR